MQGFPLGIFSVDPSFLKEGCLRMDIEVIWLCSDVNEATGVIKFELTLKGLVLHLCLLVFI